MADKSIEILMRDAIMNAETGSAYKTTSPTMGARMETVMFSTTKGNKVLCGIGIETMLDCSAWTSNIGNKAGAMIDDLMVKVDNQLRIKSSSPAMLIEWADCVLDKVQYDHPQTGTGTGADGGHSFHIYPVSGVGGSQVTVDIDIAANAAIGVYTYRSSYVVITPYYTDMPMPIFSVLSGGSPATGTGAYKLSVSGDFVGNGFLESGIIAGDGTFDNDDFRIIQEDGKQLLNQKENFLDTLTSPLAVYWQNLHQKTILADSAGFRVISTIPWSINSSLEFDVDVSGTFDWILIFKNSSTATNDVVQGEPSTPRPEPQSQPYTQVPTGRDTRMIGGATTPVFGGQTPSLGGRFRKVFNI